MKATDLCVILSLLLGPLSHAVTVTPGELADARRWVAARFEGVQPAEKAEPALVVFANHDSVQKNARGGKPMNIAGTLHTRGLYCHAFSKIIVRLPGPSGKFTALVGVDSNEQTSGGRGSVDFSVSVGGMEKFRSRVMREGMAGRPVSVDLAGATEFVIQVDETPDGISCDQADWAEAKVTLKDGREIWLADLPLKEGMEQRLFATKPPFSFRFDGKPSAELLNAWELKRTWRKLDDQRAEHTLVYTDPRTGLALRCVAVEYHDFPAVEWTLYFKNTGTADTPILENVQALDIELDRGSRGEFLLHHHVGSPANGNDYGPLETPLKPGASKRIGGAGGRPTNSDWSYFNLEWGSEGLIAAVGWPGQWSAEFARENARGLRLRASQELTRFKLLPGEDVRSPLIVLQFWKGDWIRAQNIWRRWMIAHSMPRPGGKLPQSHLFASSSRQYDEMIKANETNQIMFIDRYTEEGIKLDYWWMDAGWYEHHGGGWPRVGTWLVDSNRFPRGLRTVSDHAHERGLKVLVWFEPERVTPGTWLAKNHPEWILGGAKGGLLNLGNDDARRWLAKHVDRTLTGQGIDLYRQDFNMDPLESWRKNDAPDRQGITEIKHITGYLAYWDELLRRHPNMLIDSCASGGRRNDIETMRRAVPLWRSDYAYEAIGHQCMTYGLSLWLPFHGTGTVFARNASYYGSGKTPVEPYGFWSNAGQLSLGLGIDMRVKDLDYAAMRRLLEQWREVSPNFYGDFYPLTPWTRDDKTWMAWQFDRPETGEGLVQVFRRDKSFYEAARFKLRGLEAAARYRIANLDGAGAKELTGQQLLETGLPVALTAAPSAAVIVYQRADEPVRADSLSAWRSPTGEWQTVRDVHLNPTNDTRFTLLPGEGVLVNGAQGRTVDLLTKAEFGDVEVHVEFCIARHSNSGVYLMGRYEVQIYDSHGVAKDKYPGIECGGIYPRWNAQQGESEGHSPRVNASQPAGAWQSFDILFRAPRFDAAGKKRSHARFVKVVHNGQVVHENVELTGPTRAARWESEAPLGPLLLQGDHGPVAFRNVIIRRLSAQ